MNNWDGDAKSQKQFIMAFQNKVNKCILGRKKITAQWRIPLADDGKAITEVNLPNVWVRKIIKQFSILTDIVFANNEDEHVKWNQCVDFYRQSIELLHIQNDFKDDDAGLALHVQKFQSIVDEFFIHWVQLVGREGITNYFHMIGSGHLAAYMKEWRCLYKYEQHGWEVLNAVLKTFYFCRTKCGGTGKFGSDGDGNHRLVPIAKWLQHHLMWKSGKGTAMFSITEDDLTSIHKKILT